jgi:phytoene dehydrogenase-like protein
MEAAVPDVLVIGGGLAGLSAALAAARAGAQVQLVEAAPALGGRAQTHLHERFHFNLGPHALYRGGAGMAALKRLGVKPDGAPPPLDGFGLAKGALAPLPSGLGSLVATPYLSFSEKIQFASGGIAKLSAKPGESWGALIERAASGPRSARLLQALGRLTTYANDPEACAAAMLTQLKLGTSTGVLYLHEGWGALVAQMAAAARAVGVTLQTGRAATEVRLADVGVHATFDAGASISAKAVVLALPPAAAAAIFAPLRPAVAAARPVYAACLDVALSALPQPKQRFVLGIDTPLYLSVHSGVARLAPEGGAMVHVLRYLAQGERGDRAELERMLDQVHPGWRTHVVHARFLPAAPVAYDTPCAAQGGFFGRQRIEVASCVFAAGDWVGAEGWLSDAALASGEHAGILAANVAR